MRLFEWAKDGGPDSPVEGFFIVEIKSLFTIVILKFNKGGREAYHTHAFNAWTWFLWGILIEEKYEGGLYSYSRGLIPKYTPRENNHRVLSVGTSWCLSIRGPWAKTWTEHVRGEKTTYGWGRLKIDD